jgi:flavin reductase (DIM6/NTAB) family NADH-FMN oxidoreductase RutF
VAEPGGGGPIGPYPPGVETDEQIAEYDKLRRRVLWTMPSGLYVIGSRGEDAGVRHLMTANWVTQVSFAPKLLAVSVERTAVTHGHIAATRCFSVSTIDREDRALVRKFTKPTEANVEAHTINDVAYVERVTGAPILSQAVAFCDCELRETLEVGGHTLFVGEVVDAAFLREDEATPVLRMEDTRMNYGG